MAGTALLASLATTAKAARGRGVESVRSWRWSACAVGRSAKRGSRLWSLLVERGDDD
jgi:hypothetical protein